MGNPHSKDAVHGKNRIGGASIKAGKKDRKAAALIASQSSGISDSQPAFVIESENEVDCSGLTSWSSHDNLLHFKSQSGADPAGGGGDSADKYIAQFDFHTKAENQLPLRKGEVLRVLGFNESREWCEAQRINQDGVASDTELGWVPFNHLAPLNSTETHSWYHGPLSKIEAEHALLSGVSGSFLVRESEGSSGTYTISLRHDTRVYHYRITYNSKSNMYFISEEAQFDSLEKLIHFHSKHASGLRCLLKYPAPKRREPTVFGMSQEQSDKWEINRAEIQINEKLGSGQYGDVYSGTWTKFNNEVVAVKTLKDGTCSMDEFMQEAQIMKQLKHPNLVQLLGVCTHDVPIYIVTEFMSEGNLLTYIRREGANLTHITLMFMSSQVSSAMAYLESMNYIHRDLAARNCLVAKNDVVKVADFGLSRLIGDTDECYHAREGAKFPIKWTAPESLAYNMFSTKSDVWAFGILLWEIATYGMSPYPGVELTSLYEFLKSGDRMRRPENCPDSVYLLMRRCWEWLPKDRPSFAEIDSQLNNILDEVKSELEGGGGSGGVSLSPQKKLRNKSKSSMDGCSEDSMEGVSDGSRTPGDSPSLPHKVQDGSDSGFVQSTPESENEMLRNALFRKKNAPAPPTRTSSFNVKDGQPLAPFQPYSSDTLGSRGSAGGSEDGQSPANSRRALKKIQLNPAVDQLLGGGGGGQPGDAALVTFNKRAANLGSSGSDIRSMKTMSVYQHNQSSDSEEEPSPGSWKQVALQRSSSNTDMNETLSAAGCGGGGMDKLKPIPYPRSFSNMTHEVAEQAGLSIGGSTQALSTFHQSSQRSPGGSTFIHASTKSEVVSHKPPPVSAKPVPPPEPPRRGKAAVESCPSTGGGSEHVNSPMTSGSSDSLESEKSRPNTPDFNRLSVVREEHSPTKPLHVSIPTSAAAAASPVQLSPTSSAFQAKNPPPPKPKTLAKPPPSKHAHSKSHIVDTGSSVPPAVPSNKPQIKHGHSKSTLDGGAGGSFRERLPSKESQTSPSSPKTAPITSNVRTIEFAHQSKSQPEAISPTHVAPVSFDAMTELKAGVALRTSVRRPPQLSTMSSSESEVLADVDLGTLCELRADLELRLKAALDWTELQSDHLSEMCAHVQRFHECCKNYSMVDLKVFSRRTFTQNVADFETHVANLRKSAKLKEAHDSIHELRTTLAAIGDVLSK